MKITRSGITAVAVAATAGVAAGAAIALLTMTPALQDTSAHNQTPTTSASTPEQRADDAANPGTTDHDRPSTPDDHEYMSMHHMAVADEFEFLVEMIPHHDEAIDRAGDLLERSSRPEMHNFARTIIDTQTAEVAQMRAWLAERYPDRDMTPTYTPMMRDLSGLSGDELDRAFLEDMIPHHMTAVMMSQQLISENLAEHADVVPFAETIRDTQAQEVGTMTQWLPAWFGPDAAYRHGMGMHSSMGTGSMGTGNTNPDSTYGQTGGMHGSSPRN